MPPLVKYRPGSSAGQSSVPEWQRFLNSLPGGDGMENFGLKPAKGSPEDVLARAETAYQNKRDQASALGVEGDGSSASGLLTSALGKLDYLRAATFSAGHEVADALGTGDASMDDFRRQLDERMGFGDTELLEVDEDDGGWEKALKLGAAFVGDVATDPLTYVTAGSATIGKKATAEIVQSTIGGAAKDLSDDVVQEFAQRSLRMRGAQAAREAAEEAGDDLARETAEALGEAAATKPATFAGTQEEWVRQLGESHFGSAAAEAYQKGGHSGLFRFLTEESGLSKADGERLFDSLPRELKGGIRVRVPLARRDGLALTYGFGGAGRPARALLGDELGGKVAAGFESIHAARNVTRASRVGRAIADRFGGADGELYGQMVADLTAKANDGIGGVTYAAYDGVRRARTAARELGEDLHSRTLDALGRAETFLAAAPNEQAARDAYQRWFHDPAALRALREEQGIVKGADGAWYRPDGTPLAADANEAAGLAAAIEGHGYLNQTLQMLRDSGLSVGEIRDYVPRIMSEDEKYLRALKKPAKGSQKGQTGSVAGTNPTKQRERYIEATVEDGPNGPQLGFRWLTPEEIRQAEGRAIFEVDPNLIVAGYGDAARKLATRQRFASVLHEAGVVAPGGTSWQKIVNDRAVRDVGRTLNAAGRRYTSHLERMAGEAAADVEAAERAVARAEARRAATEGSAERGALEADELRAAAEAPPRPVGALAGDSPLTVTRGQYVDDEAAGAVERAQARLELAAERRRLDEARARHADAVAEYEQAELGGIAVEGAILDGRGAPLFRALFAEDGRIGFGTGNLPEDDAAEIVGALTDLGWVHTPRRIEPGTAEHDELAKVWGGHRRIPDSELTVDEWLPPSDDALVNARRHAYQAARRFVPDDWQERVAPHLDALADAVRGGERQIFLDMLPDDPDDLAAVVRMVDELEQTGWRLAWRGTLYSKGEELGWYLKNYAARREGGALPAAGVAARDLAAARKLRELGYDVPDPALSTSPLSAAQAKFVKRIAEQVGIQFDEQGRGLEKAAAVRVTGTPEELRRWADQLDGLELPKGEARTAQAAAKKLRAKADEVDESIPDADVDPSVLDRAAPAQPSAPRLDDFLDDAEVPSLGAPNVATIAKGARAGARRTWDEAFRTAVSRGRLLPDDVYQSATPQVRSNVERLGRDEQARLLREADELEAGATAEFDDAAVAAGAARARRFQAEQRLAELEADIDRVATDRDALSQTVRAVLDADDPEVQYEQIDALMGGLLDFHQRHAARYAKDLEAANTAHRRFLLAKQEQYANRLGRRAKSAGREAKTGRQDVDTAGMFWQDQGLVKVAGRGDRPNPTADLSTLPPELDVTYAPEMLARTIERFYKASRPNEDVKKWLDSVYRPYFYLFKAYATVGRGPGYHVRNLVGGMWNNWLGDATAADHNLSSKLVVARREAKKRALREEAERVARSAGISVKEAEARVAPQSVSGRIEEILERSLSSVRVADDLTLYDVHRMSTHQGIGLDTRVFEGVHAMTSREPNAMRVVRGDVGADLFSHLDGPERNAVQRGMNRAADNWWINTSSSAAQLTEEYLRNAMFIRGLRTYGKVDDGRAARLLVEGFHFNYQDLSDAERWTRNTLIPFYVWTRRNLPVQFSALVKEPGKIMRLVRANEAAREMFGDDEETIIPDWMRENLGWASTMQVGGNPIVFGVESPVTDLNSFIKVPREMSGRGVVEALGAMGSQAASAMSPVVKLPVEMATGTDTFTGAQFNPAGSTAPWWYRALPDAIAPTRVDEQGKVRGNAALISGLQDALPPLGVLDRGVPLTPEQRERAFTNYVSLLAPIVAASTLSPGQKAGELRSRTGRLDEALEWGPAAERPEILEVVRGLLEDGYTPEQVAAMLVDSGVLPR